MKLKSDNTILYILIAIGILYAWKSGMLASLTQAGAIYPPFSLSPSNMSLPGAQNVPAQPPALSDVQGANAQPAPQQLAPQLPAARSPANALPPGYVEPSQQQVQQAQAVDPGQIAPTPPPLPAGYGGPPVAADTPLKTFVAPDPSLGAYVAINGRYLYCGLITPDFQYLGDPEMREWWDRFSPEMKRIQAGVCH